MTFFSSAVIGRVAPAVAVAIKIPFGEYRTLEPGVAIAG